MDDADQPFCPNKYGSLWPSSTDAIDPHAIAAAATALQRDSRYIDSDGYECELFAATIHPTADHIAYVESRAKQLATHVDIAITLHLRHTDGSDQFTPIRSYNPYFGCSVRFFKWMDDAILLIYEEKHYPYVCHVGPVWPPRFIKLEKDWLLKDDVLAHIAYKATVVRRLSFPNLDELGSLPLVEAEELGLLPT